MKNKYTDDYILKLFRELLLSKNLRILGQYCHEHSCENCKLRKASGQEYSCIISVDLLTRAEREKTLNRIKEMLPIEYDKESRKERNTDTLKKLFTKDVA